MLAASGNQAAEVLVVLSDDKAPYHLAEDGLLKALAAAGHHATVRELDKLQGDSDVVGFAALVGIGSKAAAWLHEHDAKLLPLVFCMVSDPAASGLAKPPPMSGVTTEVAIDRQLALIAETLPGARTIGMLYRDDQERSKQMVATVHDALPNGWKLEAVSIDEKAGAAAAIDRLFDKPIDVVWTAPDSGIYSDAVVRSLLLTALRHRIPVFGFSSSFVRSGALLGIGIDPVNQGAQAATILQRLLAGAPGDAPIISAPTFEVEVNVVVAQKLSIELPATVIGKAHIYPPAR